MASVMVQQMEVPVMYRCGYSGRVMVDPMIVMQTGKTYNKSSIKHLNQDEIQNLDFMLMPDLKNIIQKYLEFSEHDNQPEEIPQNLQEKEEQEVIALEGLSAVTKEYESKMVDLRRYNTQVQEAFESLGEAKESTQSAIQNFQTQKNKFCLVEKQLQGLDLDSDSEIIWDVRNNWIATTKLLLPVVDDCSQMLLYLFQKKKKFEQIFTILKSKEQKLVSLRNNLQNILQDFNVGGEFDALSKQYTKPKKIQESQLDDLFTNTFEVSNVSVHLESSESNKVVEVNGVVCVKNLQVTSAMNGVKYLQFVLKNPASKIEFFDCKFVGVGLWVTGYQSMNCVFVKNMEVLDAPEHSIRISTCNSFQMNEGTLKNSQWGLVLFDVSSSIVENVTSKDILQCGFFSQDSIMHLKNCVAINARQSGVRSSSNATITAQNMTFEGNAQKTMLWDGGKYIAI